jgi:hypothetical protein
MNGVVLALSLFCAGLCFDARTLHSLALGDLVVRPAAITILTIAGASFATGRSVVMFINRGGRSCLLWRSVTNAVLLPAALLAASIATTAYAFDPVVVAAFVAAPLTLLAFGIIPYVGLGLTRLLGVWAVLNLIDAALSATRLSP